MSLDHDADLVKQQSPTRDAFLGGRLVVSQPAAGFRAGLDSVLLGASVRPGTKRLLDLGAGVGTAALVALANLPDASATLAEIDQATVALAAAMVLMVLRDFGHASAFGCFKAALSDSAPGPRVVAAEGLAGLRASLNDANWTALLAELQKTLPAETSAPAADRMYRVLLTDTDNRAESVVPVLLAVLNARLSACERDGRLLAEGDGHAAVWLLSRAERSANKASRLPVVRCAGRLLADAVHEYTTDKSRESRLSQMEPLLVAVETRLESLVKAVDRNAKPPDPAVRTVMLAGGSKQGAQMSSALARWVGTVGQPGLLNQAPFNLPVGLDIRRKPATTATAPS